MAIIDVKKDWSGFGSESSSERATAPLMFTVTFDGTEDPGLRPFLAESAAGIPARNSRHPNKPYLRVERITTTPGQGPLIYEVRVYYTTRPANTSQTDPYLNPLDQPAEIEWGFVTHNEPIDRALDGTAIVNSAGQSFDPPITREFHDLVLRYTRNEASYAPLFAADYIDSINSDYFFGFPPEFVKCNAFTGRRMVLADLTYWSVNYELQFCTAEYLENGEPKKLNWQRRVFDQGMYTKDGVDTAGYTKWKPIIGSDLNPVSEPVPLDGNGGRLSAVLVNKGEGKWLTFDLHKKRNFSSLGLV